MNVENQAAGSLHNQFLFIHEQRLKGCPITVQTFKYLICLKTTSILNVQSDAVLIPSRDMSCKTVVFEVWTLNLISAKILHINFDDA